MIFILFREKKSMIFFVTYMGNIYIRIQDMKTHNGEHHHWDDYYQEPNFGHRKKTCSPNSLENVKVIVRN